MAGDNDVDAVHRLGQFLILRGCQRVPGAAVGQADDDLRPLPLQLFHTAPRRFRSVRPGKAGGGRTFIGVHPHQPEQAVGNPAPLQRHAVGDAVIVHGGLDEIPVRVFLRRSIVGFQKSGQRQRHRAVLRLISFQIPGRVLGIRQQSHGSRLGSLGGIEHLGKAGALVVKLVVADGGGVIAQGPHGPQLRRLGGVQGLDQGADGKVPAVHQQGIRMGRLLLVNGGFQPGIAAAFAAVPCGLRQEVGMEVMGKQDGGLPVRRRCGPCRNGAQRRQHQGQQPCGYAAEFHGRSSLHNRRESGKDSLFDSHIQPYRPIIPAGAGPVNKPAYRSRATRSSRVSRRTAS